MSRNSKEKKSKKKSKEIIEEFDTEVTEGYEDEISDDTSTNDSDDTLTNDSDDITGTPRDETYKETDQENRIPEVSTIESGETEDAEKKVDLFKKHIEREAILDQIFDENGYKKDDIIKEDKEKVPYKGIGIFTLIIAILNFALIGLMVYFIILNPYYIKSGKSDNNLAYPELASSTDSEELSELLKPYFATATDAEEVEE